MQASRVLGVPSVGQDNCLISRGTSRGRQIQPRHRCLVGNNALAGMALKIAAAELAARIDLRRLRGCDRLMQRPSLGP